MTDRRMQDLAEQWRLDALRHQRLGRRRREPLVLAMIPGGEEKSLPPAAGPDPDYDADASHNRPSSTSPLTAGGTNQPAGGLNRSIAIALLLFGVVYLAIWLILWLARCL